MRPNGAGSGGRLDSLSPTPEKEFISRALADLGGPSGPVVGVLMTRPSTDVLSSSGRWPDGRSSSSYPSTAGSYSASASLDSESSESATTRFGTATDGSSSAGSDSPPIQSWISGLPAPSTGERTPSGRP